MIGFLFWNYMFNDNTKRTKHDSNYCSGYGYKGTWIGQPLPKPQYDKDGNLINKEVYKNWNKRTKN